MVVQERFLSSGPVPPFGSISARHGVRIALDPHGFISFWDHSPGSLFGFRKEEITGKHFSNLFTQNDIQTGDPWKQLEMAASGVHHSREELRLAKGGSIFQVKSRLFCQRDGHGNISGFLNVISDLKEVKKNLENMPSIRRRNKLENDLALRQSEERCNFLAESMPNIVWTNDAAGNLTYVNRRWFEYTGLSAQDMDLNDWLEMVHSEDISQALGGWQVALKAQEPCEFVFRLKGRGENRYRWHLARISPQKEGEGIIQWVGTATDIHDQKISQEELRRLSRNQERRIAERTAQLAEVNHHLESFAYSVSHDLKAPLRGIRGFAQILVDEYSEKIPEAARSCLSRIIAAGDKMECLISDLLELSKISRSEQILEPVDPAKAISEALSQLSSDIEKSGAQVVVATDWPEVLGSHCLLVQVLSNLFSNSIKYVGAGVTPRIKIFPETSGSRRMKICVRDNGIGISEEFHMRIFQPFHRLHGESDYPGSGIGLAIVQKGAERMDGRVGMESAPGAGSTFWIELPTV